MFGETTISYIEIWNHPIETTIYKLMFQVPGSHIYFSHFSKNTWNLKQPFFIGCFRILNLYMTNGWKSPNIHLKLVVWSSNNRCIDLMWFSWHFFPTKRQRFCTGCHYCVLRWAIWSSSCGRQIRMRNAFQNTMVPWPKRGKKGVLVVIR